MMIKKINLPKITQRLSIFLASGLLLSALFNAAVFGMDEFADEHFIYVFSPLSSPKILGRTAQVSHQWNRVSEDKTVWKAHGFPSK